MSEVVSRRCPIDLHTKEGIANSTPDNCTFNFADSGVLSPDYPTEVSMELTITSVQFPNVLTAVQDYNSTFFIVTAGVAVPVVLPKKNFKGLGTATTGLAAIVQNAMVAATYSAWNVSADTSTNTLTFTAPASLTAPASMVFTTQVVNGLNVDPLASACNLLGFKQGEVKTFNAGQSVTSSVPCQASGASTVYIACDLFSLESATVDIFGQQRRGTLLGKLNVTDAPWTVSAYQDALTTFSLKMPAYNVAQLTIYLLNEYKQPCGMPIDWTMSGVVTYYKPSPWIELNQKLESISQTLTYLWLQTKHAAEDQAKRAKLQAKAAQDLAVFQGRPLEG